MPLPSKQKFRKKSICPMNGRLFSTHRVLPRGPLKLLLLLLRLCQPSPLPEPDVTRSLETWKSFRLVRNPKSFRMTVHRPPPPVFLSSRNSSVKTVPGKPKQVPPPKTPKKPAETGEPEFELDQEYELVLEGEPLVPAYDQRPPGKPVAPPRLVAQNATPPPPASSGFDSDQFLADLAKEIDQLGIGELSPGFSETTPNAQPPAAKKEATSVLST